MAWRLHTLLLAVLLTRAAAEESNTRSSRQLMYPDIPVIQPTVQYYFIQKIQNGPESNSVPQATNLGNYPQPFHSLESFQQASVPSGDPVHHMATSNDDYYLPGPYSGEGLSFRQLNLFGGIFNNRFANGNTNLNTFRPLNNKVSPFIINSEVYRRFGSCDAGDGQMGICVFGPTCSLYGGQPSSASCQLGMVCCVNVARSCSSTVTLNNTYFQSPSSQQLTTPTACTLNIKLDNRLKEQPQPICQVRLDFISFTIAQPSNVQATGGQCLTDTFQVGGMLNTVPTICGDNDGQHMYLHVPPSDVNPSSVRLSFNLGKSDFTRSWNIKITMLPCSSSNLAPPDCLQYMRASSGSVQSFNWKDVTVNTIRQLANQNYKICIRTEIVDNKRADRICFTECTARNGDSYLLSGANADTSSLAGQASCAADFIGIAGVPLGLDRFCGNILNQANGQNAVTSICTSLKPFELLFVTNDVETSDTNNSGFCLLFQQSSN